jgi:predicted phosphoribosyltransferase
MFNDRNEAAVQLSKKLEKYRNTDGIVLAIPRGGVPIGYIIAKELGMPLEVVLSKKIGYPNNPEYAIGSVSMHGSYINEGVMDVPMSYIQKEADRIMLVLKDKFKLYMGDRKPSNLKGKTVIIVDDGIATGSTMYVTVNAIKKNNPKAIIIAVPVAPPRTAAKMAKIADEFVCLLIPVDFMSVGQFYYNFSQVTDTEVIQLLQDAQAVGNTV